MTWQYEKVPGCCKGIIVGNLGGVHGIPRQGNIWDFVRQGVIGWLNINQGYAKNNFFHLKQAFIHRGAQDPDWESVVGFTLGGNIITTVCKYNQSVERNYLDQLGFTFSPYYGSIEIATCTGNTIIQSLKKIDPKKLREPFPLPPPLQFAEVGQKIIIKDWYLITPGQNIRGIVLKNNEFLRNPNIEIQIHPDDIDNIVPSARYMFTRTNKFIISLSENSTTGKRTASCTIEIKDW